MIHELTFDHTRMQVRYNDILRTATLTHLNDDLPTVISDKIIVDRTEDHELCPVPWSVRPFVNAAGQLHAVVILDDNGDPVMRFTTNSRELLDAAMRIVELRNGRRTAVTIRQVTSR